VVSVGVIIKGDVIEFGIETYKRARLTDEERKILEAEFATLFNVDDSMEKKMLKARLDTIIAGLEAVKFALDNKPFRGVLPADTEIGWGRIRPEHLGKSNWKVSIASAGWTDWLGTWTSPYTVHEDVGFIVIGFKSYSASPKLAAVHAKIGRQEMVPIDVRFIKAKDNPNNVAVASIPTLILMPKVEASIRLQFDETGEDEVEPIGVAVGLGRFLKKETY